VFALGNATFACGVCSARERSFEEASVEMEVGRGLLALEPRPQFCNVVVKLVQEYKFLTHFTSVLLKQFAGNDTFPREANSYK